MGVTNLVQYDDSNDIPHEQRERVSRTLTKIFPVNRAHNIRVLVDKLEEALQAPEKTFAATHDAAGERVIEFLHFVVDIFQYDTDNSNYGDNQCTEGNSSQVIPKSCKCMKILSTQNDAVFEK